MSTEGTAPTHVRPNEGHRLHFLGMDLVWKITSEMSGGSLISFVHIAPTGTGVPMHTHRNEDEFIYCIEGDLRFRLGEDVFDVGTGDTVFMAKGTPHAFRVTSAQPAHVLFTLDLSPSSDYKTMFEGLVGLAPTDFDRIKTVTSANDVDFLTPPVMP